MCNSRRTLEVIIEVVKKSNLLDALFTQENTRKYVRTCINSWSSSPKHLDLVKEANPNYVITEDDITEVPRKNMLEYLDKLGVKITGNDLYERVMLGNYSKIQRKWLYDPEFEFIREKRTEQGIHNYGEDLHNKTGELERKRRRQFELKWALHDKKKSGCVIS